MKLKVKQSCEQGTARGVMKFRKGDYAIEEAEFSASGVKVPGYRVSHEVRRSDNSTSTVVPKSLVDKMISVGVAALEE